MPRVWGGVLGWSHFTTPQRTLPPHPLCSHVRSLLSFALPSLLPPPLRFTATPTRLDPPRPQTPLLAINATGTEMRSIVLFLGIWRCLGSRWIPGKKVMGHCWAALSGSTRSQSPPSARRISSGFLRGSSLSGRTRNRSSVSARTTFISVMANVCPMQFLWAGAGAVTAPGTLTRTPKHLVSGP